MSNLQMLGSETAKNGFKNEYTVRDKFNNWTEDKDAQKWLCLYGRFVNCWKSDKEFMKRKIS